VIFIYTANNITSYTAMSSRVLLLAASEGDESELRLQLDWGADVHVRNEDRQTPLLLAVRCGHKDMVRLLLDHGADIEVSDKDGYTALLLAVQHGHKEVVRLLLKREAEIEATDEQGQTALIIAASLGYDAIVRLLLKEGADTETTDDDGNTAAKLAGKGGRYKVVQLLEAGHSDVSSGTKDNPSFDMHSLECDLDIEEVASPGPATWPHNAPESATLLHTLKGCSVEFSPDGKLVATVVIQDWPTTVDDSLTIKIYDIATGALG
jgi:ankyrin repeat protein